VDTHRALSLSLHAGTEVATFAAFRPRARRNLMALSLNDIKGCSIDRQRFTWRELV
jgi:hypothetical protein